MIYREALGEEAARGMGGDDGCFKVQGVHECCEIRRKSSKRYPSAGWLASPWPAASGRKREWMRAGDVRRARRSAKSLRGQAIGEREDPGDRLVRHREASLLWEVQQTRSRASQTKPAEPCQLLSGATRGPVHGPPGHLARRIARHGRSLQSGWHSVPVGPPTPSVHIRMPGLRTDARAHSTLRAVGAVLGPDIAVRPRIRAVPPFVNDRLRLVQSAGTR